MSLSISRKRSREQPSIASLSRDLATIKKERDSLALQLGAARQALHRISALEPSSIPETNGAKLAEVILIARATADTIDVSKLLAEIRSAAVLEVGKDTARLNALESLASSGPLGFGYEQFRGAFLDIHPITERERNAVSFAPPPNFVRILLDGVLRRNAKLWRRNTLYCRDCIARTSPDLRNRGH